MLRYIQGAKPVGLAALRMGEGAISVRFERRRSVRCPSRLTILTKPWKAAGSSLPGPELHGRSIRRKRIPIPDG